MNLAVHPDLLHAPLYRSDADTDTRVAFMHGTTSLDYAALSRAARSGSAWLRRSGCATGDRIAIALPKNLLAIRSLFSVLAAGAVVIPIDPSAPPARILSMLADARPQRLITTRALLATLQSMPTSSLPPVTCLDTVEDWDSLTEGETAICEPVPLGPDAPAVFYYTSGTTGKPKAIVLTHANISSFARWAIEQLGLLPTDRFASHAPLHFDLTTLDLYAGTRLGASTLLLDDVAVKFPAKVSQLLESSGTTVWYSVPTALALLVQYGAIGRRQLDTLRMILFAGEPFPVPALRQLMHALPGREYINLYGPTETNVCTYYRVADPLPEDTLSLPIGRPCEHVRIDLLKEDGAPAAPGEEGEIVVTGPAVMAGYWNNPSLTESVRVKDTSDSYRTGDFGRMDTDGCIHLAGRRDELVKVRGYRIELLEIAATLNRHEKVREAAAYTSGDPARLIAAATTEPGSDLSTETLLQHCRQWLPTYAVPDKIHLLTCLPRTSTGKIDKQSLKLMLEQEMP